MKKLILVFFALFICLSLVSASADNAKAYDSVSKTVSFTDKTSAKLADVQLKTPLVYFVMSGKNRKVAEFTINLPKDTDSPIDYIRLYDKKGNTVNDRAITYKIKTVSTYKQDVPVYKTVCGKTDKLVDMCTDIINGYTQENRQLETWTDMDKSLKAGNYTIGIFTDVKDNDYVEWIPSFFGVDVTEWAVWTSSFNNGLMYYYNFSETSGTKAVNIIDGVYNLTTVNGHQNVSGKSGYGYSPFSEHNLTNYNLTSYKKGNTNIAFSFWLYKTNANTGNYAGIVSSCGVSACNTAGTFMIRLNDGGGNTNFIANDGGAKTVSVGSLPVGYWENFVVMLNSSNLVVYQNGTLFQNLGLTSFSPATQNLIWWDGSVSGDYPVQNIVVDELGVWNRTLSASEISDLYNAGAGIYYSASSGVSLNVVSTLNSPADSNTSLANSLIFNATAITTGGNVTNMTLYVDTLTNFTVVTGTTNTTTWNIQGLSEGSHNWNVYACGKNATTSLCVWDTNRTLTINTISPVFSFINPANNSIFNLKYIFVNVSATSSSLANITVNLYNNLSVLIASVTNTSSPLLYNFTNLNYSTYILNATATDTFNRVVFSGNWNVTLMNLSTPPSSNYLLNIRYDLSTLAGQMFFIINVAVDAGIFLLNPAVGLITALVIIIVLFNSGYYLLGFMGLIVILLLAVLTQKGRKR